MRVSAWICLIWGCEVWHVTSLPSPSLTASGVWVCGATLRLEAMSPCPTCGRFHRAVGAMVSIWRYTMERLGSPSGWHSHGVGGVLPTGHGVIWLGTVTISHCTPLSRQFFFFLDPYAELVAVLICNIFGGSSTFYFSLHAHLFCCLVFVFVVFWWYVNTHDLSFGLFFPASIAWQVFIWLPLRLLPDTEPFPGVGMWVAKSFSMILSH